MKEEEMQGLTPDEITPLKAYDQRDGEPDQWYARFRRFCELGPSRSLLKCYRMVMAAQDARASQGAGGNGHRDGGEQRPPQRSHVPEAWRKKAKAYDWKGRAAAWDTAQSEQADQYAEEMLALADMADRKVLQFLLNLMEGWMEGPDGEMIKVTSVTQRRMAAKELQYWIQAVRAQFQETPTEKREMIQVREVLFNEPASGLK